MFKGKEKQTRTLCKINNDGGLFPKLILCMEPLEPSWSRKVLTGP
jgi:hypothetical protein